jgi:serine/threonine protein kinase
LAKLVIENGPNKGRELRLSRGATVTCGRDNSVDLPVADTLASRKHFTIETRNGDYYIVDQDSSNGTFLNGHRIKEDMLKMGDSIRVGETLISVLEDAERPDAGGLLGQVVAGYRLEKRVGRGGMGTVYKATQLSLDRPVALKILSDDLASNREFTGMFVREARAAARLSHPNIVLAYDVGKDKDKFFFAMEYVAGGSVQELLARIKTIPVEQAVHFVIEAAKALDYAEKQGVVHRDIKPDNLMITQDDGIKICDLGLAKNIASTEPQTASEGICGSPHYIAPEQAQGKQVDHRADIYSLGATFYRMLTGNTPFTGGNIKELIRKHITEKPRPIKELEPSVPNSVVRVVERMMEKDPAKRYQSASEVISDLTSLQAFGFELELELEPADEAPVLQVAPDVAALEQGEEGEVPLLEEEEPIKLEEASPRVAVIPPLEEQKLPRAPFPWKKVQKALVITMGVLVLLGCFAALGYAIYRLSQPQKAWIKELSEARTQSYNDMPAAVEKVRKVAANYPNDAEARQEAGKAIAEFKRRLLESGTREDYQLVIQLFADDKDAIDKANAGLTELGKRDDLRAAENDLNTLELAAEAFEEQNRSRRTDAGIAAQILDKFKAVLKRKDTEYASFSSPAIDKTMGKAREWTKEYEDIVNALARQNDFNAAVEAIKTSTKNKQYAQARDKLAALKKDFSILIGLLGLPLDTDWIETAARDDYNDIMQKVAAKLAESKYDPKTKLYDNFKDIYPLLDDFKKRYGQGKLTDGENAEINVLPKQMQQLEKIRSDALDLIAQDKYPVALDMMKAEVAKITHGALQELVKQALNDIDIVKPDPERQRLLAAFAPAKLEVRNLLAKLQVTSAQKRLSDFTSVEETKPAYSAVKDDVQALKDEVAAQRDFLQAVVAAVKAALAAGKPVVLPSNGKPVASLDIDSIKADGVAAPIPWGDLIGKADLSTLFEYVKDTSLQTDSEKQGAAMLCLNHGKSLAVLKMGYAAMKSLTQKDPSRYNPLLDQYTADLVQKLTLLADALYQEWQNPATSTARRTEAGNQWRDIRDFQQELLKTLKPQEPAKPPEPEKPPEPAKP